MRQARFPTKKIVAKSFFEQRDYIPKTQKAQAQDLRDAGISISQTYYQHISRDLVTTKTIKTGLVNADLGQMVDCMLERAIVDLNMVDAIAMDEKIFKPKDFHNRNVIVPKSHKGKVRSCHLPPSDSAFINLQLCASVDGLINYKIIPNASKIDDFNQFVNLILDQFEDAAPRPRIIVLDNATFHKLSIESKMRCEHLQFSFSFDPPYACIFNPVEEIFSKVAAEVGRIIPPNINLTSSMLARYIEDILEVWLRDGCSFHSQFSRAGIGEPSQELPQLEREIEQEIDTDLSFYYNHYF